MEGRPSPSPSELFAAAKAKASPPLYFHSHKYSHVFNHLKNVAFYSPPHPRNIAQLSGQVILWTHCPFIWVSQDSSPRYSACWDWLAPADWLSMNSTGMVKALDWMALKEDWFHSWRQGLSVTTHHDGYVETLVQLRNALA